MMGANAATAPAYAPISASQPNDGNKSCEELLAEIGEMEGIVAEANQSQSNAQLTNAGIGIAQSLGLHMGGGLATAKALQAGGANVIAWDDNPDSVARAEAEGVPTRDLREIDWSSVASFVLSPGVPLTHPKPHWTVGFARNAGVEIIGDVEIFVRERRAHAPDCPFIAITGTNGKSTTTALIAHILQASGRGTGSADPGGERRAQGLALSLFPEGQGGARRRSRPAGRMRR